MVRMTNETPFTIRLPMPLASALRERAAADRRSVNKEIVFLLEQILNPLVDADAYAEARRTLGTMPHYSLQPFTRPVGPSDNEG
jgi:hypothetical protein